MMGYLKLMKMTNFIICDILDNYPVITHISFGCELNQPSDNSLENCLTPMYLALTYNFTQRGEAVNQYQITKFRLQ